MHRCVISKIPLYFIARFLHWHKRQEAEESRPIKVLWIHMGIGQWKFYGQFYVFLSVIKELTINIRRHKPHTNSAFWKGRWSSRSCSRDYRLNSPVLPLCRTISTTWKPRFNVNYYIRFNKVQGQQFMVMAIIVLELRLLVPILNNNMNYIYLCSCVYARF